MKLSKWCKKHGLSYQTGWNLFKAGNLENAYQLPSGTILIDETPKVNKQEFNVAYARVSSSEQRKTNLESQADRVCKFMEANGKVVHKITKEVGSGLNDNRKELTSLLSNEFTHNLFEILIRQYCRTDIKSNFIFLYGIINYL